MGSKTKLNWGVEENNKRVPERRKPLLGGWVWEEKHWIKVGEKIKKSD